MAEEATPPSVPITGNLRITFVPKTANPKSAAILNGATAQDITYSLTPTGWRPAITEASISDGRMSQRQILNRKGNFSEAIEIQYVYGSAEDVANLIFEEDVEGFIVVRDSVANEEDYAAGDLVDVYSISAGKQRKDPPTENALQTKTQGMYLTGTTQRDQALAA
jgi:hypothetical protein